MKIKEETQICKCLNKSFGKCEDYRDTVKRVNSESKQMHTSFKQQCKRIGLRHPNLKAQQGVIKRHPRHTQQANKSSNPIIQKNIYSWSNL